MISMGQDPLKSIRVLVVDNDQKILDLMKAVMDTFGFKKIVTAKDGNEALRCLRRDSYDLVITDWYMEGMNGLDFIHYLRTSPDSPDCFIPVIMITGKAERQDIEAARDVGVTEFLAKPFSVADLRERIIAVFERPREFVLSEDFVGPSRRRKNTPFEGKDRRSED